MPVFSLWQKGTGGRAATADTGPRHDGDCVYLSIFGRCLKVQCAGKNRSGTLEADSGSNNNGIARDSMTESKVAGALWCF